MTTYAYDVHEIARTDDGRYRAIIELDDYAAMPDGDCYPLVFTREYVGGRYVYAVESAPYGYVGADELADRLTTAENYGDESAVELALSRAAVDWHEIQTYVNQYDADRLAIITPAIVELWGADVATVSARDAAADWQAWLDGECYTVAVERRPDSCTIRPGWMTGAASCVECGALCDCDVCGRDADADGAAWESVESVGGHYGRDWAESAARELLAAVTDRRNVA